MKPYVIVGGICLLLIAGIMSMGSSPQAIFAGLAREQRQFKDVTVEEAAVLIKENQNNPNFMILDVRTPEEFSAGHIATATLLDFYTTDFRTRLNQLDRTKTYLVYCRSGNRSGQTLRMMEADGFTRVYNLLGGITKWYEVGFSLE